jgi:hypothetical protein
MMTLRRKSITIESWADGYTESGTWLGNKAAVDRLDGPSGSMTVATAGQSDQSGSEVSDLFGGPFRGRTYGPLIKSERKGMTQVVEDLGHPLVISADPQSWLLPISV